MNTDLITKTENFLKQKFDNGAYFKDHPDEKAYRLEHSYRVANIGKEIAQKEGFYVTEMVVACLLHDVSYCEDFDDDGWKDHGRNAAKIAHPFLLELGLPQDRVNFVSTRIVRLTECQTAQLMYLLQGSIPKTVFRMWMKLPTSSG